MRTPTLLLLLALAASAANAGPPKAQPDPWRVVSISEPKPRAPDFGPTAVIRFAGGATLRPGLYGVSVIGWLPVPGREPLIVLDGSGCGECDLSAESVFIGRVTAWPRKPSDLLPGGAWFSQAPHRNVETKTKTLWDWSRLFIGRCLGGERTALVSFSANRDEKTRAWPPGEVKWALVENGRLVVGTARIGAPSAPSLDAARQAVKQGVCRELPETTYDEPF